MFLPKFRFFLVNLEGIPKTLAPDSTSVCAREMRGARKNVPSSQMTLDFGQKNYGTKVCKECHMIYTIGDTEDFQAHARFHSRYMNPDIKVHGLPICSFKEKSSLV